MYVYQGINHLSWLTLDTLREIYVCMCVYIYIYLLHKMAEINVYETSLPQVKVSQAIYEVRMHIQAALSDRVSTIPKYPKTTA